MKGLEDLAKRLESLSDVCTEAAAEIAPEIEQQVREIGKADGPLRAGNAVACRAVAEGTRVHIRGVFTKKSKQRSWTRTIQRAIAKAVKRRLKG